MCVVIFPSENEKTIPSNWITGIDITKLPAGVDVESHDQIQYLEQNSGPGKAFPGGPECDVGGKKVPCFVTSSPHGGITGEILAATLRRMDQLELFERSGAVKPFLLLDGHSSRFEIEFLEYISDPAHPWAVCIGVPYGTHLWQVADSSEQNGCFKIFEVEAKERLLEFKSIHRQPKRFGPTDVIPIVNYSWDRSMAKVESNKKAIAERGWNPLNRNLLCVAEVLKTKQGTDSTAQDSAPVVEQTLDVNTDTGTAAELFDKLLDKKNNDAARQRAREREAAIKWATSGAVFKNSQVGLHRGAVLENQRLVLAAKQADESRAARKRKQEILNKKAKAQKIRERTEDQWTVSDLKAMCTYKKVKGDPPLKEAKGANERVTLSSWWDDRRDRPSPQCSPLNSSDEGGSDDEDLNSTAAA